MLVMKSLHLRSSRISIRLQPDSLQFGPDDPEGWMNMDIHISDKNYEFNKVDAFLTTGEWKELLDFFHNIEETYDDKSIRFAEPSLQFFWLGRQRILIAVLWLELVPHWRPDKHLVAEFLPNDIEVGDVEPSEPSMKRQ